MLVVSHRHPFLFFFFFNDTATTEIYTLSLHDALPISCRCWRLRRILKRLWRYWVKSFRTSRSEEHTSELQSPCNLVCRLLLEKKNLRDPAQRPAVHEHRCVHPGRDHYQLFHAVLRQSA